MIILVNDDVSRQIIINIIFQRRHRAISTLSLTPAGGCYTGEECVTHAFKADEIGEVVETPVDSSHNRRNIFRGDIRRRRRRWRLLGETTATERDRICPLSRPPVHQHAHAHANANASAHTHVPTPSSLTYSLTYLRL